MTGPKWDDDSLLALEDLIKDGWPARSVGARLNPRRSPSAVATKARALGLTISRIRSPSVGLTNMKLEKSARARLTKIAKGRAVSLGVLCENHPRTCEQDTRVH